MHGVAMIPNKKIERFNKVTKEVFEVFFTEKTIRDIAKNYFKKGYQTQINLQHTNTFIDAYVFSSFIVDRKKGFNPPNTFKNAVDGTWIVGVQLDKNAPESKTVFEAIKKEIFTGFSIEGYFVDQLTKNFNADYTDYLHALNELEKELDLILLENNIKI
ncbi:XkdF-like putative serine protease domain-containing protein [Sphingobacterium sp. IITKGP-BTPF85]|uniref:XkdF-like putative serine protease domain-containing protein n=1 Tax=Sphingobacterium sp. IITKGP-BTPF85 TaxID=1338009 RepID=UPI00038A275E|nr:hypothetical protein L950_0216045 [Sphingobacterium sp. IITKGP-BTPF85]